MCKLPKKQTNNYVWYKISYVKGGNSRQESTYNALKHIKKKRLKCSNVLIHDSARPNFSIKLIKKIIMIMHADINNK